MPRKLTIKKVINTDPAIKTKRGRIRYVVSDGWTFPTRKMALLHIKKIKS